MMRQTGGLAVGDISTRSRPFSRAFLSASNGGRTPTCLPSSSMTRTSLARMRSFMRIKRLSMRSSRKERSAKIITEDVGDERCWNLCPAASQAFAGQLLNMRAHPLVGRVLTLQAQLQVIFCERLRTVLIVLVQRNGINGPAHKRAPEGEILAGSKLTQHAIALARELHRNLIGHHRCWRARAGGKGKNVQVGEWQPFNKGAAFFEKFISFAREANHNVSPDGGIGHGGSSLVNSFRIVPGAILAMHPAQDPITARLQRGVYVFGNTRRSLHEFDERVAPVHRFHRAEAQFLQPGLLEDSPHQLLEAVLTRKLTAPSAKVDPAENHLAVTGLDECVNFA